jgi:hypothetical protein
VVALASVAFLRVFALNAALPFFNGIDEHNHVDLVQKYSRGFLPGPEAANFDAVTVGFLAAYGSPEYLNDPKSFDNGRFPTLEEKRAERPPGTPVYRKLVAWYTSRPNFEAEGPPTYYALAGAWLKLGRTLGLEQIQLLYWIRWLNPLLAAVVVLLTHAFLRRRCPEDTFRRLGPCVFLAGYPNDLQYGVTPDVLSIGLGAICFFGLVRMCEAPRNLALAAATGLAIGLAFLNKYPNVLFAGVAFVLFWIGLRAARRAHALRIEVVSWSLFGLSAALPALWWLERNLRLVGSLSGANRKMELLHWSYHDLDQILAHPVFSVRGWFEFIPALLRTFWQGEFAWHGDLTHTLAVDVMYVATSLIFVGVAAWSWIRARPEVGTSLRIDAVALLSCTAGVTVLAVLSTLFDYGLDEGPLSRAFPFFASGRLIAGVVVPFAVLYCSGVERIWSQAGTRWARLGPWLVLCAVLAIALGWQLAVFHDAFGSSWNWYNAS